MLEGSPQCRNCKAYVFVYDITNKEGVKENMPGRTLKAACGCRSEVLQAGEEVPEQWKPLEEEA